MQLVFALAGIKPVIAAGKSFRYRDGIIAKYGVITIVAVHFVMPGLTGHPVIACTAMQRVVARALHAIRRDHAGAFSRFDREILVVVAPCPFECGITRYRYFSILKFFGIAIG